MVYQLDIAVPFLMEIATQMLQLPMYTMNAWDVLVVMGLLPMKSWEIHAVSFTNACTFKFTVNENGAAMVCATMAKHAIHVQMIVGNAGVPLFQPQVPLVLTTDIRLPVNAVMALTTL